MSKLSYLLSLIVITLVPVGLAPAARATTGTNSQPVEVLDDFNNNPVCWPLETDPYFQAIIREEFECDWLLMLDALKMAGKLPFFTELEYLQWELLEAPPTAEMEPAPPPKPQYTYTGDAKQWQPLVAKYFAPSDVDKALSVIDCESNGDPNAFNPSSGASGLFQHIPLYWLERSQAAGFGGWDIFNPEANVGVAAWLVSTEGDWNDWPNCGQ